MKNLTVPERSHSPEKSRAICTALSICSPRRLDVVQGHAAPAEEPALGLDLAQKLQRVAVASMFWKLVIPCRARCSSPGAGGPVMGALGCVGGTSGSSRSRAPAGRGRRGAHGEHVVEGVGARAARPWRAIGTHDDLVARRQSAACRSPGALREAKVFAHTV
jgi:hypothetical protein